MSKKFSWLVVLGLSLLWNDAQAILIKMPSKSAPNQKISIELPKNSKWEYDVQFKHLQFTYKDLNVILKLRRSDLNIVFAYYQKPGNNKEGAVVSMPKKNVLYFKSNNTGIPNIPILFMDFDNKNLKNGYNCAIMGYDDSMVSTANEVETICRNIIIQN